MLIYQRETSEFQAVDLSVTSDGIASDLTTADVDDVDFVALPIGTRPTDEDWVGAEILGADLGLMVDGLDAGVYALWFRVRNHDPEVPVDIATYFRVA